jgi:tripartite-type tricarboxylate transporter receptor subunit TctC
MQSRITLAVIAAISALCAAPASADDFYKGKTVTVVVGFSPGGGYDQYARLFARYVGEHLPGKPNVIVQNMPGAGSLTSVRHLDVNAAKDGTVITAFNPGVITDGALNPEKIKVKLSDYTYLGSITRDFRICYAYKSSPITGLKDLQAGKEFILGATGLGSSNYVNGALLRTLLGFNVKQVMGYPGSNEMRLGIERGELFGDCGSFSSIPEDWIKDKIIPLVSFSPAKTEDMPDVPYARNFVKDEANKLVFDMVIAAGDVGRPFIVSKLVPADRVEILRKAFDETMSDKNFLAEAKKEALPVYPVDGKAAQKIVDDIYKSPPEIADKARKAIE